MIQRKNEAAPVKNSNKLNNSKLSSLSDFELRFKSYKVPYRNYISQLK